VEISHGRATVKRIKNLLSQETYPKFLAETFSRQDVWLNQYSFSPCLLCEKSYLIAFCFNVKAIR
jgi:hypothetical protein